MYDNSPKAQVNFELSPPLKWLVPLVLIYLYHDGWADEKFP